MGKECTVIPAGAELPQIKGDAENPSSTFREKEKEANPLTANREPFECH